MDLITLVKTVEPDFPTDRRVVSTPDFTRYFKINYNQRVLYVPDTRVLWMNHLLIDQTIDAIHVFAKSNLVEPDWSTLTYETDQGNILRALEIVRALKMLPANTYVACDIESRNTSFKDNALLCISFCYDETSAVIITIFNSDIIAGLNEVFAREDIHWIWQNGKFDIGRLNWLNGIRARVDEDTMLMHYVGINERSGTHGLKEMGALYLGAPDWDAELDSIKKEHCRREGITLAEFDYGEFPQATLQKYASFDVIVTRRLFFVFQSLMRESSRDIYKVLITASNVFSTLEQAGVYIDMDYLEDLEFELDQKITEAQKQFDGAIKQYWDPYKYQKETGSKSFPKSFNKGSPAQLKWLLNQVVAGQTITDTRKETLDDLTETYGDQYPIIGALRELRKYNKYMDTYIMGIRKVVCFDNRLRSTYNLHGTETGRLSSSDPNMQNIPRDKTIKNLFVASAGNILVQLDYSQAELRVLAYLSQDTFLKKVYQEGRDLHDAVATQMFGPGFTKEQRVQAKTINFGIAYGRGPASLVSTFGITMNAAQALIRNWFKQMPGVEIWIQNQRRLVDKGTPPTSLMGRERHFIIMGDNYAHVQNECVNFPIQSLASDMTLISLIRIAQWIQQERLTSQVKIIITVHDSILLEVKDDPALITRVAEQCTYFMANTPELYLPNLDFPFRADVEVGYKWGDLHAFLTKD